MWIIPSNHPLSSHSALEYLGSSEDLKELASIPVSWPTWRSKPSSLQTWLRAWKRVYWIPHLFGRMLKPSMHVRFVEEYTASLAVIHVLENPSPGYAKDTFIKDSFGRLYADRSQQQDLFGASSKTWMTTLRERIRLYNAAYAIWVTQLRKEYIQREKLARHRKEKEFSSLPWPTATVMNSAEDLSKFQNRQQRMKLKHGSKTGNGCGMNLATAVRMWNRKDWPTAAARDCKGCNRDHYEGKGRGQQDQLPNAVRRISLSGKDLSNGNGKNRGKLNPAWVAQFMGTTLTAIFFVPLVTQSWSKQQR